MKLLRLLAAGLVAALLLGGLAVGSSLRLPTGEREAHAQGILLLDWRLRGEEAGACLPAGEGAESGRPIHMQNPDACAGELPPYRLRVEVDGVLLDERLVRGGGLRGDRPLTVYERIPLPPGDRRVRISFERETPDASAIRLDVAGDLRIEGGRVLLAVRRQDTGILEFRVPVR
jgi:hypothetical protein